MPAAAECGPDGPSQRGRRHLSTTCAPRRTPRPLQPGTEGLRRRGVPGDKPSPGHLLPGPWLVPTSAWVLSASGCQGGLEGEVDRAPAAASQNQPAACLCGARLSPGPAPLACPTPPGPREGLRNGWGVCADVGGCRRCGLVSRTQEEGELKKSLDWICSDGAGWPVVSLSQPGAGGRRGGRVQPFGLAVPRSGSSQSLPSEARPLWAPPGSPPQPPQGPAQGEGPAREVRPCLG